MKINDKNQPFIYIRTTGEKIPVSREVRDACYGEAARIRMREQADGHCLCPQSEVWVCDGDCLICEHRRFGDLISLDVPVSEDGEDTLLSARRHGVFLRANRQSFKIPSISLKNSSSAIFDGTRLLIFPSAKITQ